MKTFILHPLVTEKSMAQSSAGVYQFVVPSWASKPQIAAFVANHFSVRVAAVRTIPIHGKKMVFRRKTGQQANYKKALVELQKGDSIAEFNLPIESTPSTPEATTTTPAPETVTKSKITVRSKAKKAGA